MLIKRNLLLFFRDRANVFFSLLAVLIIIGLYVLFLGDSMEQSLRETLGFDSDRIAIIMASIILAGMVAVTSVTSCLGALSISIADKHSAIKDFYTSPVPKGKITLNYMLASATVGLIMTVIALILCVAYIVYKGGSLPGWEDCALLLLTVVLSVLCGNSIVFFITIFVKSQSAYSALSMIVGTLIGFIMGIYIPIGILPDSVQWVIKCFPMTHAASMFKQIFADAELKELFANAPPEALESFRETFGIVFSYGDHMSGFWFSALILAATTVLFYTLSLIAIQAKR